MIILFFPPNCTSLLQPADIRMIAGLKVGYRVSMLRKLLAICDDEELYDEALIAGKKAPKGCNGLSFCGKAHLLDAMLILDSIWSGSINKYCSEDSIKRCWRRSGLLSISTVADMNNDIGSSSLPEKHKKISAAACNDLCSLFHALTTTCAGIGKKIPAVEESIVYEDIIGRTDLIKIMEAWIGAEDDPIVIASDIEETIADLESEPITGVGDVMEIVPEVEFEADENLHCFSRDVSWSDCHSSFKTIRHYLKKNGMKTAQKFELAVEAIRLEKQDRATSQLSIKNFFQRA